MKRRRFIRKSRRKTVAGFTLVEMLVALLMTSVATV